MHRPRVTIGEVRACPADSWRTHLRLVLSTGEEVHEVMKGAGGCAMMDFWLNHPAASCDIPKNAEFAGWTVYGRRALAPDSVGHVAACGPSLVQVPDCGSSQLRLDDFIDLVRRKLKETEGHWGE